MNQGVSVDELLTMVARTASELMSYDFSSVTVPDATGTVLQIRGSYGLSDEYIRDVNSLHPIRLRGTSLRSPSSQAFAMGIPIQIQDAGTDPSIGPWAPAALEQGYTSMIAIPLNAPGGTLGILNCFTRRAHYFDADEVSLLAVLADQAAIAINTARLRAEQASTITKLNTLNQTLEEQYELQRQVADVHHRLTSLALSGGGLDDIGTALSALLSRAVVIRSGHETVKCGSSFGSDMQLEALMHEATQGVKHPVKAGTGLSNVMLSLGDGSRASAVRAAVVVKEEVVAWMWTIGSVEEFTPVNLRAIEHAATVLALELLSARSAAEAAWHEAGEILREILTTRGPLTASLITQAARMGHDLSQPHALILSSGIPKNTTGLQERVAAAVHHRVGYTGPQPLLGFHQDFLVTLWPLGDSPMESVRPVAEGLRLVLRDGGEGIESSLSVLTGPISGLQGYLEAFSVARGADHLARLRGIGGRTLLVSDLGTAGLLLQVPDSSKVRSFCEEVLGPLRRHDSSRRTTLLQTLRTLMRNNLDEGVTAAQLSLDMDAIARDRRLVEKLLGGELTNVATLTHLATALELEDVLTALDTGAH
ncbi:GAF domain-containing protein [Paenarthrobacter sp. TYUT067]|uniref:helix-turn-helix domain-containing protein n=1 Tax=Paenarthrobacter sp. TYUT067 TaxID=2926245 RepID=UPI00202E8CB8|nr:GAF domain-containing protein [Paenarthrobacter sp. TYUT067]MCM0614443.1 GAF domain-containing protein [Paenarthrobacter sp. TYUT067]